MSAIIDFEDFLRHCNVGQPLNRGTLAEDSVRGVLKDWDPDTLQLAPRLVKERQLELAQRLSHGYQGPGLAPSPGGTMGGSSLPGLNLQNYAPQPPTNKEE